MHKHLTRVFSFMRTIKEGYEQYEFTDFEGKGNPKGWSEFPSMCFNTFILDAAQLNQPIISYYQLNINQRFTNRT